MHYFNSFGTQEDGKYIGENDAETTKNTYQ